MAEKITRRIIGVDEAGKEYEITEYVLVATTSQLSDSHVAESRSPPRYRLPDGRHLESMGHDAFGIDGKVLRFRPG